MPKVSICIPAYKQVEYLRKALRSVEVQTFTDYEIVLTDDSSDDAVQNLLKEFDFKEKLRYFKNSPALGSPANWNLAILESEGEYIKILHHDDFFTSTTSLQHFVNLLDQNPKALFAFSGAVVDLVAFNTQKKNVCTSADLKKIIKNPEELLFSNKIGAPSATIVRNQKDIFFDVQLKWLVDIDWYITLLRKNSLVVHTQKTLICTTHGAEGQVTQAVQNDRDIQLKEHLYLLNKLWSPSLNFSKLSLYFQILFHKYKVNSLKEISSFHPVGKAQEAFFSEILAKKNKNIFFKKVIYWMRKMKAADYWFLFKMKLK